MLTPRKDSSVTHVKFPWPQNTAARCLSSSDRFLRRLERGRFLSV